MRIIVLVLFTLSFFSVRLLAWGPHGEIAQAALNALGADDPLVKQLGVDAKRLNQYVWMADWRQQLLVRGDEVFYSDDVLLFPATQKHIDHICPAVMQTYSPYFRRALQAMRTESTHNAARWIGSLLHFTTDTGSPPHALGISGPTHSKMENWLDAKLIHLPGYQAQLLGADDAAAEAGFLKRMDGLIAFSKLRAERCRADVEADQRPPVEPVVLESALETARVTADLLHTLGVLAAKAEGGASLRGRVIFPKEAQPPLSRLPAKIILSGTLYSTLTAEDGSFAFHHLPAGSYQVIASVPGFVTAPKAITLSEGADAVLEDTDLSAKGDGNLIRNGSFALRWVSPDLYDNWSQPKRPAKLLGNRPLRDWEGEWIPLTAGTTYELSARWKAVADSDVAVFVRTKAKPVYESLATESESLTASGKSVRITGSPEVAWAQVCIRTALKPGDLLDGVSLHRAP